MGIYDKSTDPDGRVFRQTMGLVPTPVTIVTGMTDDGPAAMVIGSFVSVSLDPPLVGFFVGSHSGAWEALSKTNRFCINVLSASQSAISRLFVGNELDRFDEVRWIVAENGAPALEGCVAWIEADLTQEHSAGDHTLILCEVTGMSHGTESSPLVYHLSSYGKVEHAPLA